MEKSLHTTNKTVLPANINLSVGGACQNALCSADDATKTETAAIWRLSMYIHILGVSKVTTQSYKLLYSFIVVYVIVFVTI